MEDQDLEGEEVVVVVGIEAEEEEDLVLLMIFEVVSFPTWHYVSWTDLVAECAPCNQR